MSTARRDLLQQIEVDVQKKWDEAKVFESDAPAEGCEKFMCTFPYPYMNGMLHIGHAFSLTKAIFAAHFNRLLGKKVLFPFGFHCTGMPIQAAANKLRREYEIYGSPFPVFPAGRPQPVEKEGVIQIDDEGLSIAWKIPPLTGQKAIKAYHVHASEDGGDFVEVALVPATDAQKGKVQAKVPIGGTSVYQVMTELEDGSFCPASNKSDEVTVGAAPSKDKKAAGGAPGKRVAKKTQAKTGDAAFQYEILLKLGIDPKDIAPFQEPEHWLHYFPPIGVRDLRRFATPVDFRRSFITTSINPYYDSFIRWQFGILKKADKIGFGKRPTIFSELDGQACMDHDRAEGEGVQPQEYTAIKIEVLELPPAMEKLKGNSVFLLAATLRPETMPGQTNCWILPEGTYGCYQAKAKNEVFVCSHRAARNMSFQEILEPWGKPQLIMEVTGNDLMGAKVKAPTSKYDAVHVLPLLTIKMDKGTGIVTSVPSDSPDDYAAFLDLMKPGKLQHFGLKAEWVEPFEIIPIIDVEIDGEVRHLAAQYMNEKLGVQSQKDKEKLQEAHDVVYKLGFDRGIMSMGPCKGQPVKKAKVEFKGMMIKDGQAFVYSEPEKKVLSRSGDECVVAGIDQWYLKYGQAEWRKLIEDHLNSSDFCAYNDRIKESFMDAISWLKEWACSRSFGLGTRVPWDEQFVIESLSDSTIYMAYYTVSHFLHSDLEGAMPASAGIKPEDLTPAVWDYVFLNGDLPKDCKISKELMEKMRQEFRFWYPMDLRVSGKDLIQNHLTMSLYNHSCVWEEEPGMWPRGFFCNGWLLVNNEKMSKSKGNFFTIDEICNKYTADAVRLAMANAGDTLEDANFEETVADNAVCDLAVLLEEMKDVMAGKEALREGAPGDRFVDQWMTNEMNRLVVETKGFYERMYYREALRTCYFEFTKLFKQYKDICKASKIAPLRSLVFRYMEWQMIILSPICPHFCEHGWSVLQKSGSVLDARFPGATSPVDITIIAQGKYIFDKVPYEFRKLLTAASKNGPPTAAAVYVARKFPEWKESVLQTLRGKHAEGKVPLVKQDDLKDDKVAQAQWKEVMTLLMQDASLKPFAKHVGPFAAFKRDEAAVFGPGALDAEVPYDELALVTENVEYLKDKLGLGVTVHNAEEPVADDHKDAASNAQPGMPAIYYAGVLKGGGKQSGGGGRAAGGGTGPSKAATGSPAKTISDLKGLDEHMSSRSYFDGGHRPSQADVAQFAVTPSHIDADVYPHAARWYTHIAFFTAAQRARW